MADYVPMGRANTQDIWTICHLRVVPQSCAFGKQAGGARGGLLGIDMFEDLSERLFAHFVAGRWRVPFGSAAYPVLSHTGKALGQVVTAGPLDVARAVQALRPADDRACHRLAQALAQHIDGLAQAIAIQSGQAPTADQMAQMLDAVGAAHAAKPGILLSARDSDLGRLGHALGAGVMGGVIWCPPVERAVFATAIACVVQHAEMPPGAFAVLHTRAPETETALRATPLCIHED